MFHLQLALKFHPDKNRDDPTAEDRVSISVTHIILVPTLLCESVKDDSRRLFNVSYGTYDKHKKFESTIFLLLEIYAKSKFCVKQRF